MAKSTRIKIPKRVAGVKVPKVIRKGPVNDFVNSSAGQLLLAEAVIAVGTLFAAKQISDTPAGEAVRHPADTLQRAGRRVGANAEAAQAALARNTARLQFALGEAVRAFREALAEPGAVPVGETSKRGLETESDPGKKKQGWSPSDPAAH